MPVRALRTGLFAALGAGAIGIGASAVCRAAGAFEAAADTAALGLGAWLGAAACAIWWRKHRADALAAAEFETVALARMDWEPPAGSAAGVAAAQRPVALAPLEAALACGIPAPHAVAAWLAEAARSGLVRYQPGDPPVLTVGRMEPDGPYARLLAEAAGEEIGPAAATALAAHAAAEAGRKLARGGRAASAAWYAAVWAAVPADGGPIEQPCHDPLGRPPASRALARDLAAALDPAIAPATPWVRTVAARLAAGMRPVHIEAPVPVIAPLDGGLHTAVAGGAEVGTMVAGGGA